MKRLWPFLILNVAISAATVLIVLAIWSSAHPCVSSARVNAAVPGIVATQAPTATLPPQGESLFEIQAVIGAGDIQNEHIQIQYLGSEPLSLQGWQITDGKKHTYTFDNFVIYKKGAFDLYTRSGYDTTIELYMGFTQALWQDAQTITLLDSSGVTRLSYSLTR